MVVDGKMQVLPADATVVALLGAIAGDAVPYAVEAAKLSDVDMDDLIRMRTFIATDRFGRFQGAELFKPRRRRIWLTVAGETCSSAAICLPV